MTFARLRQPALTALAVLLIGGAGVAFAGNRPTAAPPSSPAMVLAVAPTPAAPTTEPATEPAASAAADTDTLQQGDQTTSDAQAGAVASAGEQAGAETEKPGAEAPGDQGLPDGGHADDPNAANADHQFEGNE